jgi:transcriptional regulator GlxA family with amidase domain
MVMNTNIVDRRMTTRRDFVKAASFALAGMGTLGRVPSSAFAQGTADAPADSTDVVIFLYDRMSALDAIGPYEVLRCVPGLRVRFVARRAGLVRTDSGLQMLNAEYGIDQVTKADILVMPGGDVSGPIKDPAVLQSIRQIDQTTTWTTSVCVGALILGAAGLLKGIPATTHWNFLDALKDFGADPVEKRFVRHGKVVTAAGVSAGIDMALEVVARTRNDVSRRSTRRRADP